MVFSLLQYYNLGQLENNKQRHIRLHCTLTTSHLSSTRIALASKTIII